MSSTFPAAAGYGFGTQALRISDAVTSGSFGDQTFSPAVSPAGESALRLFDSSFRIGTALATEQSGLHTSVSPDDGNGSRMSYLRFEDQANGVHVFFIDATNPGPLGHETTFNETDIATLNRSSAHLIEFSLKFNPGPHNDTVKIFVDGKKRITGTIVGGLLPLRRRANRQRQRGFAHLQDALPREWYRERGQSRQRLPGRRLLAVVHGGARPLAGH